MLTVDNLVSGRLIPVPRPFSLRVSVGPALWVGDRSPRHAWINDALVWCGRERQQRATRIVEQIQPGVLQITGSAHGGLDPQWARDVLRVEATVESWNEPVLAEIAGRFPGLAPYGDGSLFEGLVTSIVGQSISVASAAVTQRRLAFLFDEGVELHGRLFAPLPTAQMLADASVDLIRSSGVTARRAEALKKIGRFAAEGDFPSDEEARRDPEAVHQALLPLPQVGNWTAASALHWGVGSPDAWPSGDIALLNAIHFAYLDYSLSMRDIDEMAEAWRPYRGIAARLFWTNLFHFMPYKT